LAPPPPPPPPPLTILWFFFFVVGGGGGGGGAVHAQHQRTTGSNALKLRKRVVERSCRTNDVCVPRVVEADAFSILELRHDRVVPDLEAVQVVPSDWWWWLLVVVVAVVVVVVCVVVVVVWVGQWNSTRKRYTFE
jgi:drug/metabolite transporter (DMT)-like permease